MSMNMRASRSIFVLTLLSLLLVHHVRARDRVNLQPPPPPPRRRLLLPPPPPPPPRGAGRGQTTTKDSSNGNDNGNGAPFGLDSSHIRDRVATVANSTVDLVGKSANQAVNSQMGQTVGGYVRTISDKVSSVDIDYYFDQAANSTVGKYFASTLPKELRLSKRTFRQVLLWTFPLWFALFAFSTFPIVAHCFHDMVQWMSSGTWIRKTQEQIELQATVVTQVVNGPVITSISVLFASLVSLTISNLHSRQTDIRKSFICEVQTVRRLQQLLESTSAIRKRSRLAQSYLQQHSENLVQESRGNLTAPAALDPHLFIESSLPALLTWTNVAFNKLSLKARTGGTGRSLEKIQDMTYQLLIERSNRWLALEAMHFPAVHYLTLSTLALSIGISFLVATNQAGFIFLQGLPVKILWTVLAGSLAALGVLCYDLSRPFGGAYHVPGEE